MSPHATTVLVLSLLSVACAWNATPDTHTEGVVFSVEYHNPVLPPEDVVEICKPYLKEQGVNLDQYSLMAVTFDFVDGRWGLFYERSDRLPGPGDHFLVYVSNDRDPELKFVPGH